MTDILNLLFTVFESESCLKGKPTVVPAPASSLSVLLVGDRRITGSLLLLAAVTAASELGIRVVLFTRTQIQSLPVTLQRCVSTLNPEGLKRTTFFYPRTLDDLLSQVAVLHESPTPPSLIIVDRLENFLLEPAASSSSAFFSGEQSCAAHLAALLHDTASFLTQALQQRGSSSSGCRVIASYRAEVDSGLDRKDPTATDPILDVLERYFQVRCTLDQDRGYEAAAAAVQEVWHVYLSGRGMTKGSTPKDHQEKPNVAPEWQLLLFPDGVMKFKAV